MIFVKKSANEIAEIIQNDKSTRLNEHFKTVQQYYFDKIIKKVVTKHEQFCN